MLATLVVGQGKPKLVQISRPTSKASSHDSGTKQPPAPPQTPVQYPQEISAFSPYDTPGNAIEERLQCTPTARRLSTPGLGLSYSSSSLVQPPLSLMARTHSSQSSSTAFSNTQQHLQDLADTFRSATMRRSMSLPEARQSITALPTFPVDGRHASSNAHQSYSLPPTRGPSPEPTLHTRPRTSVVEMSPRKKLTRTLAAITAAINTYTFHSSLFGSTAISALHLFSPAIVDLRCHDIPESQYISILGKIFPTFIHTRRSRQSGEDLLSALAAWIIADLYLCKAMTGMRAAYQAANRSTPISQIRRKPAPTLHLADRDDHEQHYSYTTLINQSNSSLHRIPTKARDLLGITLSPPSHRQPRRPGNSPSSLSQHDTALLHRTIAVQQSVAVIGQKLVETLRGGLGFDEDIWRSLRVLVEVVEEGGRARESMEGVRCSMGDPSDVRSEVWV
jgi:hypothetical protein